MEYGQKEYKQCQRAKWKKQKNWGSPSHTDSEN